MNLINGKRLSGRILKYWSLIKPLPTKSLEPFEILKFRDDAFKKYFSYKPFLEKIEKKFGIKAKENIIEMNKVTLKRKIIEQTKGSLI